ncbi:restriction endonuclease subunit S [Vibrio coralliilyticus]|uniref:restriction endonuclease subunit S n=1 Tax=Vibrio coralliilyticus TaxID=190893 RepID=UPI00155F65E9|nr:restriction endonuclease subunit S [Vibrio coralliilyticus]NRF27450.1 restriction endonuclease subunit S [Vibrio coralliilyticus]NRF80805.1 restriction endonuclease subunit S [Vibrio coralliilyticus]
MELKEYSISDIATLKYGKMLAKTKFTENGYPVFSGYKITGYTSEYLYEEPEVIVVARGVGGTGDVKISPPKSWVTNLSIVLSVDTTIVDKFFFKEFLHAENLKAKLDSGASISQITIDSLKSYKFKLPDISFQRSVRDVLINYDNLIENNNRRIAILEEMAQSLYREWFVNFRFPSHEDNLDADGTPKLVDSPLGQIPERWEVKRLDDFVTLQRGFDLPKKKRNEKGCVPIYAASGINGYHDQVKAKGPGIVTGRSGTLGIVNLVLEDHWPLNTSLWVKEFKGCTAFYAYYLLDSIGLERFNSGASVPTLNRNDVHGNPVIAPPKELIEKFENIVCVNHKQINVLKRKNENLKKQRDMLLPKLISGDIEL